MKISRYVSEGQQLSSEGFTPCCCRVSGQWTLCDVDGREPLWSVSQRDSHETVRLQWPCRKCHPTRPQPDCAHIPTRAAITKRGRFTCNHASSKITLNEEWHFARIAGSHAASFSSRPIVRVAASSPDLWAPSGARIGEISSVQTYPRFPGLVALRRPPQE